MDVVIDDEVGSSVVVSETMFAFYYFGVGRRLVVVAVEFRSFAVRVLDFFVCCRLSFAVFQTYVFDGVVVVVVDKSSVASSIRNRVFEICEYTTFWIHLHFVSSLLALLLRVLHGEL